jgi:hypothetical protein
VRYKLKSLKILHIFPNGSVYFDYLAYLKTYKKYNFSKESFFYNLLNKKKLTLNNSNFFYKKYRNQIVKKLINEFKINYKKYSKFI